MQFRSPVSFPLSRQSLGNNVVFLATYCQRLYQRTTRMIHGSGNNSFLGEGLGNCLVIMDSHYPERAAAEAIHTMA